MGDVAELQKEKEALEQKLYAVVAKAKVRMETSHNYPGHEESIQIRSVKHEPGTAILATSLEVAFFSFSPSVPNSELCTSAQKTKEA